MEQDLEITAESVMHMVRTQTSSPIPREAAGIQTNSAARIVELLRRRFGKAYDAGIWKRLSNIFLEPANPFDVKARRQFRQEAIVIGTFILTALGLALYFNLKAIAG
jgi:hypothetical protein